MEALDGIALFLASIYFIWLLGILRLLVNVSVLKQRQKEKKEGKENKGDKEIF